MALAISTPLRITYGVASASDPIISGTQEWSHDSIFYGLNFDFKQTISAAGSKYFRIRGGAAGETEAMSFGDTPTIGGVACDGTILRLTDPYNYQAGIGIETTTGGVATVTFGDTTGPVNGKQMGIDLIGGTGAIRCVSAKDADGSLHALIWKAEYDGTFWFGVHSGSADAAISGYITIKDAAGNTRKLAVIT